MDMFKESTPFIEPVTPDHDWATVKFLDAQILDFGYIVLYTYMFTVLLTYTYNCVYLQ